MLQWLEVEANFKLMTGEATRRTPEALPVTMSAIVTDGIFCQYKDISLERIDIFVSNS